MRKVFKGFTPVKICGLSPLASFYFVTFSCCVTVVVPSLVWINIDSFGVIISYNLVTGNTPPKIFFPCFLEIKIRASWGYVLNSKLATREPIWLKFGQLTVRQFSKKHVCKFWFLFPFFELEPFFTGSANDLLSLTSTADNKRTNALSRQKSETRFVGQTC